MESFLWCNDPSQSISDLDWFLQRPEQFSNCCSRSKSLWTDQISLRKTVVPLAYWVICYIFIWINLNTVNPRISAPPPLKYFYYPTVVNTVQISCKTSRNVQRYCTVICTVANLFARQASACMQNCHTLPLSLINVLSTAVG